MILCSFVVFLNILLINVLFAKYNYEQTNFIIVILLLNNYPFIKITHLLVCIYSSIYQKFTKYGTIIIVFICS